MLFLYLLALLAAADVSFARASSSRLPGSKPQIYKHGLFSNSLTKRNKLLSRRAPISPRQASPQGACGAGSEITTTAPKTNVFQGLTDDEAAAVTYFLHSQPSLNLTAVATATR